MSQTTPCFQCGFPNRRTAQFCAKCGATLASITTTVSLRLQAGQVMHGLYTIARPLDRGGMGAIYLATQTIANQQRQVVIKEMLEYYDPTNAQDVARARQRFEAEAATLVTLNFANIPQIFDYFSDKGRNFIVMQFIPGRNLEEGLTREDDQGQLILGQPYPVEQVRRWGIQVCKVLENLTTKNVVHMDIKPANLILDTSDNIWLVDFGTAKAQWVMQPGGQVGLQKSSVYGTAGYAPVEQTLGKAEARSDVYALAATLYHLLTDDDPRKHPFNFPQMNQLPAELVTTLQQALTTDMNQRPTVIQFRHALETLTTVRPNLLNTPPLTPSAGASKLPLSNIILPFGLIIGTAAVVLIIALIIIFSLTQQRLATKFDQVQGTITAQAWAIATVQAQGTGTMQAQIDATAQVQSTTTTRTEMTVTAQIQDTASAQAEATNITSNQTATAQAQPTTTLEVKQAATLPVQEPQLIFGPVGGNLIHNVAGIPAQVANVDIRDFIAEVRFVNPHNLPEDGWIYMVGFRSTGSGTYSLYLYFTDSLVQNWILILNTGQNRETSIASGVLNNVNIAPDGSNQVHLEAEGGTARLFFNDEYITTLDVSKLTAAGDVWIDAVNYTSSSSENWTARYEDFSVWSWR